MNILEILYYTIVNGIVYLAFFYWGWVTRERKAIKHIDTVFTNQNISPANIVEIQVSEVQGIYYVHNMKTKEFLAQGKTHEQIAKILSAKHPTTIFVVKKENLDETNYDLNSKNERL